MPLLSPLCTGLCKQMGKQAVRKLAVLMLEGNAYPINALCLFPISDIFMFQAHLKGIF